MCYLRVSVFCISFRFFTFFLFFSFSFVSFLFSLFCFRFLRFVFFSFFFRYFSPCFLFVFFLSVSFRFFSFFPVSQFTGTIANTLFSLGNFMYLLVHLSFKYKGIGKIITFKILGFTYVVHLSHTENVLVTDIILNNSSPEQFIIAIKKKETVYI